METLARWLDIKGLLWCHPPNEAKRSPQLGRKLKTLGLKAGVPDVLIFDRPPAEPDAIGVAIELKRNDSSCKATQEQLDWLDALRDRDWVAAVCHGAVEAICLLVQLGF